jgi:alkylated DNA repair dioxygenase AlkB
MSLFDPDVPDGLRYRAEFLAREEEHALATAVAGVKFDTFEMRGVVARRRVKFYGASYDGRATLPLPEFLLPLRDRVAAWAELPANAFAMALINEYTPGATIGWHRDAPQYDIIAGVSLLSSCRLRLRPYVTPKDLVGARAPRRMTHEIQLAPRSAYLITGLARSGYEHSIPATSALRYSITFRTLR